MHKIKSKHHIFKSGFTLHTMTIIIRDGKGNEEFLPISGMRRRSTWDGFKGSILIYLLLIWPWLLLPWFGVWGWILSISIFAFFVYGGVSGKRYISGRGERKSAWDSFNASILVSIVLMVWVIPLLFGVWGWILSLSIFAILVYFLVFAERNFIFDKAIKNVIIEKRRIIDKKIKWKEVEKIKFSDIREVKIIELATEGNCHSNKISLSRR